MINKLRWCRAGVLAATVLTSPAVAAAHAAESFGISVQVPESCDIQASEFQTQAASGLLVGQVMEACNHGKGFQILASHRPLTDQEQVDVDYGGVLAHLEQSGLSPIAFRAGARYGAVPVRISARNLTQTLQVSFSLTAV